MEMTGLLLMTAIGSHLALLVAAGCDERFSVKSGQSVEVTSPYYPSHLPSNTHCFYEITALPNSGDVIHLHVLDATISCGEKGSTLEVFDAFTTNPRYLGKVCKGGQVEFVSPKNRLYLVFKSGQEDNVTRRGFKLRAEAKPEFAHCYEKKVKVIDASSEPKFFVSPYYPFEVAPNVHCRWLLKSDPGHVIRLEVLYADMKGSNDCFNFGLYVFDGKTSYDDHRLGMVCDNSPRVFSSSTSNLLVIFSAGPHVLHSGGGVKVIFSSHVSDPSVMDKDHSILYAILAVLLGLVAVTIVMILVRFLLIPARERANTRRFDPDHRLSTSSLAPITMTFLHPGPPPPYNASTINTNSNNNNNNNNNNISTQRDGSYKRGISLWKLRHIFNLFKSNCDRNDVRMRERDTRGRDNEGAINDFSPIAQRPRDSVTHLLSTRESFTNIMNQLNAGEITRDNPIALTEPNDYQELPTLLEFSKEGSSCGADLGSSERINSSESGAASVGPGSWLHTPVDRGNGEESSLGSTRGRSGLEYDERDNDTRAISTSRPLLVQPHLCRMLTHSETSDKSAGIDSTVRDNRTDENFSIRDYQEENAETGARITPRPITGEDTAASSETNMDEDCDDSNHNDNNTSLYIDDNIRVDAEGYEIPRVYDRPCGEQDEEEAEYHRIDDVVGNRL